MISTFLKIISGGFEAFLGIPILGGVFILSHLWAPLIFMFLFHGITLFVSMYERRFSFGSVLGIITSVLGWIPFVGMVMHILTAFVLLIDGFFSLFRQKRYY